MFPRSHLVRLVSFLVLTFSCFYVQCATINDLNKAYVSLKTQDTRSQETAIRQALAQVMVKLSGSESVIKHEQFRALSENVMQYVTSTQFVEGDSEQLLVIFNQAKLEKWVKRNALPLWGAQRPEALLWFIEQNNSSRFRTILMDGESNDTLSLLNAAAFNRGVEFILPIMDIEDVTQVSEIDIWGQFIDTLHSGAQRYNTPYTVSVKLQQLSDQSWQLDYFVKSNTELELHQVTDTTKLAVIGKFVDQYTERQATRYALDTFRFVENSQIQQLITINHVTDIVALSQIEAYLTSLSIVENALLLEQRGTTSTFNVKLLGQPQQLHHVLLQGNQVVGITDPEDELNTRLFEYYWR
jgi:hypothetical protein